MLNQINRNIKLIFLVNFFYGSSFGFYWLFFNFLVLETGCSHYQLGILNSIPAIVSIILSIPIGILGDRYSHRDLLILGGVLAPLSLIGIVQFSNFYLIALFTAILGISQTLLTIIIPPFLMENTGSDVRTYIFSWLFAVSTFSSFLSNSSGGYLPKIFNYLFKDAARIDSLKFAMLVAFLFCLLALIPLFLIRKTDTGRKLSLSKVKVSAQPLLFLKLLLPVFIIGLGAGQIMPFLNIFVEFKFKITFSQLGWIFGASSLMVGIASMLQPVLAKKVGRINSVIIVQAASVPLIFILGFANYFPLVVGALLLRSALMNMGNPIYNVFALEKVKKDYQATFTSFESAFWSLGWAVSSWLSGYLRTCFGMASGFNINFSIMATLYIISIFLIFSFFRGDRKLGL